MTKRIYRPTIDEHTWPSDHREVPGWPGYVVCDNGTLWSNKFHSKWTELGSKKLANGYRRVMLRDHGRIRGASVHELVLEAFVGPRPEGLEIRHLNGIRHDNRLENLKYGTTKENSQDKELHGTVLRGESSPTSKLSESSVREIRQLRADGASLQWLADKYGVSYWSILQINSGRSWKHVPLVPHKDMRSKYPDDLIEQIRSRNAKGETGYKIAKSLNMSVGYVYELLRGKRRNG